MNKLIILTLILGLLCQASSAKPQSSQDFLNKIQDYIDKVTNQNTTRSVQCEQTSDCPKEFYCKDSDCIAKKKEQASCLSGLDEECECNKCRSETFSWNKICSNDQTENCLNNGQTKVNSCKRKRDCPSGYFCDYKNENGLCISKLGPERACYNDEMCLCGHCLELKYHSRQGLSPITFNVCNAC